MESPSDSGRGHRQHRRLVFETILQVLKDEQEEWAATPADQKERTCSYGGAWGVRSAGEVAIGYLAVKRLMTKSLLKNARLVPEHPCAGGRVDLWIGDETQTAGLAIELKYLMGPREARTVRRQAIRLCGAPDVATSAGFILWGHSEDDAKFERLFADQQPGWTPWTLENKAGCPAPWRKHNTLNVWLFGADKVI